MLRLFVDFDLRMVRAHVALRASAGQPRNADRTGVPRVAGRAVSNGSVGIWFAHAVALLAAAGHGGSAFSLHERMRRPSRSSRLIGFGKIHLFRREAFLAINRGPRPRGVPAVQELLVNILVAASAISSR